MHDPKAPKWNVCIDTGGTFTDCVAVDELGNFYREKILSSSALRGSVEAMISARKFRVKVPWRVPHDFIRGFEFCLLNSEHNTATVHEYDASGRVITLENTIELCVPQGAAFEVRSTEEAPLLAARLVTGTAFGSPLPAMSVRLATTRGTNALLERRGARVAFFVTRGFGDLLRIGNQQRPDLFALNICKSEPLYHAVVEVPERLAADGAVITPLDVDALSEQVSELVRGGVECAAIAFLHSHVNRRHEEALADYLRARGFDYVSCSSELAPFIKILPRAETAVVDAYLSPVIDGYLGRLQTTFGNDCLHVMTSAGGLSKPGAYRAKDSLLSGPAGGVVGAALAGKRSGASKIIAFDMGGTSTDVARFDGDFDYTFEHEVGDAHLVAPALAIESVAAGGGSICSVRDGQLRVGPQSAGAVPGPACYGAGGPLTLTDVNLLLGRLDANRFGIPIRVDEAERALDALECRIDSGYAVPGHGDGEEGNGPAGERGDGKAGGESRGSTRGESHAPTGREQLLEGILAIANERMADAIRRISVRKGYDSAEHALVAFGGAGGQHACRVAECLGMDTVIVPADASLLSALGLGYAVIERFAERQVLRCMEDIQCEISIWIDDLTRQAFAALREEGVEENRIEVRRTILTLRFAGQESALAIDYDRTAPIEKAFEAKYRDVFGYWPKDRAIELESIRVVALSRPAGDAVWGAAQQQRAAKRDRDPAQQQRAWFDGGWRSVPVFERDDLAMGWRCAGPALIFEPHSVVVVECGWDAECDTAGALVLRKTPCDYVDGSVLHKAGRGGFGSPIGEENGPMAPPGSVPQNARHPEVVRLELFTHRFEAIVRNMGEMLRRTAVSTNVKERLDFSCALLDANGRLIANAPHIPVHLGAIGMCVRAVHDALALGAGDVAVTNHPGYGGSHLPDITVITPVYLADGRRIAYVANRAHHAEIGGIRPGSMPPNATTLVEEGVVIPPMYLVRKGKARWPSLRRLLEDAPYPSRAVAENLADLRAAVAANRRGVAAVLNLAGKHGADAVSHYMTALENRAATKIRDAFRAMADGVYEAAESLDDGSVLCVRIEIAGERAHLDFSGSAAVHPGNLNTTLAVVNSVVMYTLRLLVNEALPNNESLLPNEPLPLNEGLLDAVSLSVPPGMLNPPFANEPQRAPAVVGGNVETSQRLVDTLLKALGRAACSQGTMNNVLFGNDNASYYETVGGGAGAGANFEGASAVHTHMTNTRITDPEILEHRYPVRLERFAIRRGSGGKGRRQGGDGLIREILFLKAMSLSVLGQHRTSAPYGLNGGEAGQPGAHRVIRADGSVTKLAPVDGCDVQPGDRFVLETPGGGAYGAGETTRLRGRLRLRDPGEE